MSLYRVVAWLFDGHEHVCHALTVDGDNEWHAALNAGRRSRALKGRVLSVTVEPIDEHDPTPRSA